MQPSDVSTFSKLPSTADVASAKRSDNGHASPAARSQGANIRQDTTSVSAGARALTFHKQTEIASPSLSAERLARLREQRPQPERIADAILRAELDA